MCRERRPLLVSGGCGLNGEWNTRWRDTGLFTDVFVPPCTNDSGVAIGAAVDAAYRLTGHAKIDWTAYAGELFVHDTDPRGYSAEPLDPGRVADSLVNGGIVAWVQGRCEIGPRALGNRSLLAAPFDPAVKHRLNQVKRRAAYRPVAPVVREEDAATWFDIDRPSPWMLFFHRTKDPALKAISHVDGSARIQTVSRRQHPSLHALLAVFQSRTGYGVLCNTSLNFPRRGFINRMSDLCRFVDENQLDGMVVEHTFFKPLRLQTP